MQHTKDQLAAALRDIGLDEMADRAATGWYHDFLSPLDMPELQLIHDLAAVGTPDAMALRSRVMDGEFDANEAESDEWAASDEGRDAYRRLIRK
jgi:hypothetical protein